MSSSSNIDFSEAESISDDSSMNQMVEKETNKTTSVKTIGKQKFILIIAVLVTIVIVSIVACVIAVLGYLALSKNDDEKSRKLIERLNDMDFYEILINDRTKNYTSAGILLKYKGSDTGQELELRDMKGNDLVLFEKSDVSFMEYGEEMVEEDYEVTCRCQATCIVYEYGEEEEDERRKFRLFGVKEIVIFAVLTLVLSYAWDFGRGLQHKAQQKFKEEELMKKCESQEYKDLTCECDIAESGCEGGVWRCHATCFHGIKVMYTYPSCFKQSRVIMKSKVDMLSFCERMDKKLAFDPEVHPGYVRDNFIRCTKDD